MPPKNTIYNIPASQNFSDTLARWVLDNYGQSPIALSRVLMLLPSRRACIALRDAFLRASDGKPLLLPRMQPVGDVDEDILLVGSEWPVVSGQWPEPAFAFRRLFILAKLIQRHNHSRLDHALKLATELARLLDELEKEHVSLGKLADIVPEDFAEHWQVTVEFLKIISIHWPEIAKEEGIISPVSYRNELLAALAKQWRTTPPDYPVIVAGTTGSIPTTADLIAAIAVMPNGMIVLPAFDTLADKKYLDNITEGHAQWGMHRLLKKVGCGIGEVQEISGKWQVASGKEREKLLSEIMRPAEVSENWQTLELDIEKATSGMKSIVCADIQEEASIIALILREILEHPGKTAALITHDRVLARRVCANMKRFGVNIDDSAGIPLMETPIATFLRLIAEVATSSLNATAIPLLSLIKHPLFRAGMTRIECLEAAREYEMKVLRHSTRTGNSKWLLTAGHNVSGNVKKLIGSLEQIFAPFMNSLSNYIPLSAHHLPDIITAHLECAEALAGEDLWAGPEADAMNEWLSELRALSPLPLAGEGQGEGKPPRILPSPDFLNSLCSLTKSASPASGRGRTDETADGLHLALLATYSCYQEVFDELFSGKVFRPDYGGHTRLKILSPIEARMQSFDSIILGGLNEGSWPQDPHFDPWLNRRMRVDIGLPAPERDIGLAAHDFFTLASAPELYLTHAEKIDGAPSTPSRWLVKLEVLLARFSVQSTIHDHYWQKIAEELEHPKKTITISSPEPKPPLAARPLMLSVTQVEMLLRNPYAIYASQILRLRLLEPIMRELNGSDFGNAVHKALERFVKAYPAKLPGDAYEKLLEYGRESLQTFLLNDQVRALWWPRFTRIAGFILVQEQERRREVTEICAEVNESCAFNDFTLMGRADRIEKSTDGTITIIDYKTGTLPTNMAIESGLASQLVLLGLLMQEKNSIKSLEYWQLQGGADAGRIKVIDPADYINAAKEGLKNLVQKYNDLDFPYRSTPFPSRAGQYNDYAHLARIKEWQG